MNFSEIKRLLAATTALDEDRRTEERGARARGERFRDLFPRVSAVPVVGGVLRGGYAHGIPYLAAVLVSLMVFTAIKLPYLQAPFTGEHSMKYSTYVEPATYMLQKGTMLWYQKKYVADPLSNPQGIFPRFDHLPLMEWGLYLAYRTFPGTKMELTTRIVTHVIGLLTLLYAYLFFSRYLPKRFNVLLIALLSINPVFSFATYVTVLDSIVMFFMFVSLRQISVFLDRKDISSLIWAGIWFGVGNAVKYPLFLWLAPLSVLFLFYECDNTARFLKTCAVYLATSLLVTFSTVFIVGKLIGSAVLAAILAAVLAAFLFIATGLLRKYDEPVERLFETILKRKAILASLAGLSLLSGIVAFRLLGLSDFSADFLTDRTLVANPRLYEYMLLKQFKEYMTRNLFWFGMFGIVFAFATRDTTVRKVGYPFLFGSLVYWVVASKSIFIHIYYSLIIMISLTLFAAYLLYAIGRNIKEPLQKAILFLCFLAMILPPVIDDTTGRMKNYLNVDDAVRFIKENTKPGDFILFEGFLTPLSIYTGRGFVMPAVLIDNAIREDIRSIGFASTMQKLRIKYMFTPNPQLDYMDLAPIFEQTDLIEPSGQNFNRNILINRKLGVQDAALSGELKAVAQMVKKYDIPEKFVLSAQFGRFKFYTFRN